MEKSENASRTLLVPSTSKTTFSLPSRRLVSLSAYVEASLNRSDRMKRSFLRIEAAEMLSRFGNYREISQVPSRVNVNDRDMSRL